MFLSEIFVLFLLFLHGVGTLKGGWQSVCYLQFVSIVVIDFIETSDQNICQTCNIYFML